MSNNYPYLTQKDFTVKNILKTQIIFDIIKLAVFDKEDMLDIPDNDKKIYQFFTDLFNPYKNNFQISTSLRGYDNRQV